MDPVTSVGAGLAIIGSKDILVKILGPTADYMGGELQGLVEKCNINLDNIFVKAQRKLGDKADEEGVVSPRVLKHVLDEGRFCEDELTAEYYGGVLAASKTKNQNDDRGVSFLKQLESMSSYQIRFHYISYYSVREAFKSSNLNPGNSSDCAKMEIFFPFSELADSMDVECDISGWNIIIHAVVGLHKLGLIDNYQYGKVEHISKYFKGAETPGFFITPNISGAELFLWGAGLHGNNGHELLEIESDLSIDAVKVDEIYRKTKG